MAASETEPLYRVVGEAAILDQIIVCCWPCDVAHAPLDALRRRAAETLARWIAGGLPHRSAEGARWFSTTEVIQWLRAEEVWRGVAGFGPAGPQSHRVVAALGPGARDGVPARFEVALRREIAIGDRRRNTPLRLGLPYPCDHPSQGDATFALDGPDGVRATPAPGHLDVRLPPPGDATHVTVGATIGFTARGASYVVDPERLERLDPAALAAADPAALAAPDLAPYLRLAEGLIQVTPAIAAIARELAAGARDAWDLLHRIWAFGFAQLRFGHIHYADLDPGDPLGSLLRQRWSDCQTGAALLIGLCRAAGVPARLVSGLLLYPDIPAVNHYWLEALLPPYGWIPFDLAMSWGLALGDLGQLAWSHYFFGRIDYRMRIQHFPSTLLFHTGLRLPPAWYLVDAPLPGGVTTSLYERDRQAMVYRDQLTVQLRTPGAGSRTLSHT